LDASVARGAALCSLSSSSATPGPQATDLFLAPLSIHDGRPVIGTPVNVTNRAAWRAGGYDNQPTFTLDGRAILFTSKRDDVQSDIYRYDIASRTTTRVTATPESESSRWSCRAAPGFRRSVWSATSSELGGDDSIPAMTQRLWSFALDGSDAQVVLASIKTHLVVRVDRRDQCRGARLREAELARARRHQGPAGRTRCRSTSVWTLAPLADHRGVSFTHRVDSVEMLASVRWPGATTHDLVALPSGLQDVAWLSSDLALASSNSKILYWHTGGTAWSERRISMPLACGGSTGSR